MPTEIKIAEPQLNRPGALRQVLNVLSDRERRVFETHGLSYDPITLEQLSDEFGGSKWLFLRICAGLDGRADPWCLTRAQSGWGRMCTPRECERGAKRPQEIGASFQALEPDHILLVTRLDRFARSTHDLLNALASVEECDVN